MRISCLSLQICFVFCSFFRLLVSSGEFVFLAMMAPLFGFATGLHRDGARRHFLYKKNPPHQRLGTRKKNEIRHRHVPVFAARGRSDKTEIAFPVLDLLFLHDSGYDARTNHRNVEDAW